MTQKQVDYVPRLTRYLVDAGFFKSRPMMVLDVGASGGFEPFWSIYQDQVKFIGFEPNLAECEKLNQNPDKNKHVYPVALHKDKKERLFYHTALPDSSGFYEPNMSFLNRFFDYFNLKVVNTSYVATQDLDSFAQENSIEEIDYIKMDTEGAELDILEGAANLLENNVMAVNAEVLFIETHKGRPLFSEIEMFLREKGFVLYSMGTCRRLRNTLPHRLVSVNSACGQTIWGEVLFFRDAVAELEGSRRKTITWDTINIMKLASIMETYFLHDSSIELLQVAARKGLLEKQDADLYIDLLIPKMEGVNSYKEYFWYLKTRELPVFLKSVADTRPNLVPVVDKVKRYFEQGNQALATQTICKEMECLTQPYEGNKPHIYAWQKFFYELLFEDMEEKTGSEASVKV